jgi:hypothetical protein
MERAAFTIACTAFGEDPIGFSLEASFITLRNPSSRFVSSIGLPAMYSCTSRIFFLTSFI